MGLGPTPKNLSCRSRGCKAVCILWGLWSPSYRRLYLNVDQNLGVSPMIS